LTSSGLRDESDRQPSQTWTVETRRDPRLQWVDRGRGHPCACPVLRRKVRRVGLRPPPSNRRASERPEVRRTA